MQKFVKENDYMKNIWKYILIGLGVVIAEWVFLALSPAMFNGLEQTGAIITGAAFFLSFEMVICTGVIVSKINSLKNK